MQNIEKNPYYRSSKPRHSDMGDLQYDNFSHTKLKRIYLSAVLFLIPLLTLYPLNFFSTDAFSLIGTVYAITVLLATFFRVLKIDVNLIWTGYALYPIGSALFFGFGPLVHSLGNAETLYKLNNYIHYISKEDLLRVNLLNYLGITLVMSGMWAHMHFVKPNLQRRRMPSSQTFSVGFVGLSFLFGGLALKYLIIVPSQWGMIDFRLSGAMGPLALVADLGFAIIAFLAVQTRQTKWKVLFWTLWPLHLLICVISVSKLIVMLAVVMPLLGAYTANRHSGKFILGLLLAGVVYMASQPWTQYGRAANIINHSSINPESYSQGLDVFRQYVFAYQSINQATTESDTQSWWTRLNYSVEQDFAMNLYDSGNSSKRLEVFWMSFIPRAIWPDKPIISGAGQEFYTLITGNTGSSTGLTIYADMYWHYGWTGVWTIAPIVGLLFGILSNLSLKILQRRDFIYLPIAGLSIQMFVIGPTSFLVVSIIGPIPIILSYFLLISAVKSLAFSNSNSRQYDLQSTPG